MNLHAVVRVGGVSRFRLSAGGSRAHEPWFRLGTLDVGTTWIVAFLSILALLAYAFDRSGSLEAHLAFLPNGKWTAHHPWTLLTWPFAIGGAGGAFNFAIGALFLWYFGRDLESSVFGRTGLAYWLLLTALGFAVIVWGLVEVAPSWLTALYGLQFLGLAVFIMWVAEWPRRMFLFNIPAWVLGVLYVGIQVAQDLHDSAWALLFGLLLGLALSGFIARQYGALGDYAWIPRLPGGGPSRPRRRRSRSAQPTVVAGPWQGSSAAPPPPINRDAQRMDELLDKISAQGTESLTAAERRELEELRLRRRR